MNRRITVAAMALTLSLSAAPSMYAAPFGMFKHAPAATATADKSAKMVSFHMRNDSTTPIVIKAGEQQLTLEPGKKTDVKMAEGDQVVAVNGTSSVAAGGVLTTVSRGLQGNTLAIR